MDKATGDGHDNDENEEERARRRDAGKRKITERDAKTLEIIGEQFALSIVDLQTLLGHARDRSTRKVRERWADAGWVTEGKVVQWHPTLVWLTPVGKRTFESPYKVWTPKPGMIEHILTVNAVRWKVMKKFPGVWWVCERELAKQPYAGKVPPHRPDAVLRFPDKRVAIEVELTQKSQDRLVQIILGNLRDYDEVWYFATREAQPSIQRLRATNPEKPIKLYKAPEVAER